jgi:PAS domain S-box-containing protein
VWLVTAALMGSVPSAAATLTAAAQIKNLTLEEARRGPDVVLKGIVTHIAPEWSGFALQDGTDAIYVAWTEAAPSLSLGQSVEVSGQAIAGNFAPSVRASAVRILTGGAMPTAAKISWEQLSTGACDNRYVEIAGVVRSARPVGPPEWSWPALALRIDVGGNVAQAYLRGAAQPPQRLLDATVRARGVCLVIANGRRQFVGGAISISRGGDLILDGPGAADPFDAPHRPLDALFGYTAGGNASSRTRVAGTATAQVRGGVYIQDGAIGLLVRGAPDIEVRPGDRIEAAGYPSAGDFSAVLEDAVIRVAGHGAEPAPLAVEPGKVLQRVNGVMAAPDGVLVQMAGTVLDWAPAAQEETLLLEDGATTFAARLPGSGKARSLAGFATGSRVAVTGICVVSASGSGSPRTFELLLRSAGDVTRIAGPPLSRTTALQAAGILLGVLAAAAVWLALLKRRVARQTVTIRAHFEREAALEQRYADLVENASDAMYVRDLDGRFLQVNRGTVDMTGYSREELLSMNVLDLVVPEDRERLRLHLANPEDPPGAVSEWRIRTRQGTDAVVEVKARLLREHGRPACVECIGRDVTERSAAHSASVVERRRLEDQLHQSQKMESIGLLAGGVAHDFNNLLTVISGYAQMAADDVPPLSPARDAIDEIAVAADRAAGLTRQLLTFSRRQMTAPKVLSVNELIANVERMLRRLIGEDIELSIYLGACTGTTRADAGHLEQVVMNLAINARDAMPGGGRLSIETADVEAGEADDVRPGRYVELCVTDTGAGIPAELRGRIFEPFFTTKEKGKGTGLGLSTVYGIVKQSGGTISVESEPGRGSKFRVLLPAVERPPVTPPKPAEAADPVAGSETILLAEDEEGVRRFVASVLRSRGYSVLEAANGREALEVAGRHGGPIHLLLSDVVMPEMGGVELAERFSAPRPEAAVLMMTGYAEKAIPAQHAANVLLKPFTPAALLGRVRQAIGNGTDGT